MNKKGQIIIYVFIGIIILFVIFLFVIIRSELAKNRAEEYEKTVISVDFEPVRIYVDSCLKRAVSENLMVASLQGGYIDTSEVFEYIELGVFKVPYYYNYYSSKAPSFTYIKTKLEEEIAEDIVDCILKLKEEHSIMMNFDEINFDLENMRLVLLFSHNDVIANLKLKTEAKLKDGKLTKESFEYNYKYPTNFYKFYLIAKKLAEIAAEEKIFEKMTLEVIASNLPYKGYYFGYSYQFPKVSEAKEKLFNALVVNFRYIILPGFTYSDIKNNSLFSQYFDYYNEFFKIDIKDERLKSRNIRISFTPVRNRIRGRNIFTPRIVQDDDFYFSVDPSIGDMYKPINIKIGQGIKDYGYIPIIPLYIFDYRYYVDYGILVSLENIETQEVFYFGLRPKLITTTFLKKEVDLDKINQVESVKEIIASLENIPSCNGDVVVKVFVEDRYTGEEVNNADVYFYCAGFACYMGKTSLQKEGGIYLRSKVPKCLNPIFIADMKDFYFEDFQYSGEIQNEEVIVIEGDKFYQVPVEFRVYNDENNLEKYTKLNIENLAENEDIFLTLESDIVTKSYVFNLSVREPKIHLSSLRRKYNVVVSWVEKDREGNYQVKATYGGDFEAIGFVAEKIIIPLYPLDILVEAYRNEKLKNIEVET